MSMLKDLFTALSEQAVRAAGPKPIDTGDWETKAYLTPLGEVLDYTVTPPARAHTVDTLHSFIDAVKRYALESVVWHNTDRVVFIVDDDKRYDQIVLHLVKSAHFITLENIAPSMTQRDFVRLLRYDLAGCVSDTLRPAIAKLETASSIGTKSEINPGREQGTREFAVSVSGDIPETFVANVSVYANAGLRQLRSIKMSLDYTLPPKEVSFTVKPLPDEMEIAVQDAQAELHDILVKEIGDRAAVFAGTP